MRSIPTLPADADPARETAHPLKRCRLHRRIHRPARPWPQDHRCDRPPPVCPIPDPSPIAKQGLQQARAKSAAPVPVCDRRPFPSPPCQLARPLHDVPHPDGRSGSRSLQFNQIHSGSIPDLIDAPTYLPADGRRARRPQLPPPLAPPLRARAKVAHPQTHAARSPLRRRPRRHHRPHHISRHPHRPTPPLKTPRVSPSAFAPTCPDASPKPPPISSTTPSPRATPPRRTSPSPRPVPDSHAA